MNLIYSNSILSSVIHKHIMKFLQNLCLILSWIKDIVFGRKGDKFMITVRNRFFASIDKV